MPGQGHPLVIDNGSGSIKSGYAADNQPKLICQTAIGRPKHVRVMLGAGGSGGSISGSVNDVFVGNRLNDLRGLCRISYPINNGIIQDWNSMEILWQHSLSELKIKPEEHPVLLVEPTICPPLVKERILETFFESFGASSIFLSSPGVLSLYASGRTTGLVLDCGEGSMQATPVYEGFDLGNTSSRSCIGGRAVTEFLSTLLRKSGALLPSHCASMDTEHEICREMKESIGAVSAYPSAVGEAINAVQWALPDGNKIFVGGERVHAPECLFQPEMAGFEARGCHELLLHAVAKADITLRRNLLSNIVLAGGSTMFPGFGERLLRELRKDCTNDCRIRISAPSERRFSSWIGGSIVASLGHFKKMWITRNEYNEMGAAAVLKGR